MRYAHGLIADYLPEDVGKQLATSLGFVTRFVCMFFCFVFIITAFRTVWFVGREVAQSAEC